MGKGTTRPVKGVTLSLVGSLIMLVFGNPALPNDMLFVPPFTYVSLATPMGQLSFICGVLILAFGYLMTRRPKPSGIIIMILAITSIIAGLDRYYIGSILALTGGLVGYMGK